MGDGGPQELVLCVELCTMLLDIMFKRTPALEHMAFAKSVGYDLFLETCVIVCRVSSEMEPFAARFGSAHVSQLAVVAKCMESLGGIAHHHLKLPHDLARYGPQILYASRTLSHMLSNPWDTASRMHGWLSVYQGCCAPDCCQTFYGAERVFKVCARCKIVRYCSTTCQETVWQHPEAPHRAVCKHLRVIDSAQLSLQDSDIARHADPMLALREKMRTLPRRVVAPVGPHGEKIQALQFAAQSRHNVCSCRCSTCSCKNVM